MFASLREITSKENMSGQVLCSRLLTIIGQPIKPQRAKGNMVTIVSSFLVNLVRLISSALGWYGRPDAAVYGFQAAIGIRCV